MSQTIGRRECEVSQTDAQSVIGRVLKRGASGSREREVLNLDGIQVWAIHKREKARALRAYRWLATACTFATQATASWRLAITRSMHVHANAAICYTCSKLAA